MRGEKGRVENGSWKGLLRMNGNRRGSEHHRTGSVAMRGSENELGTGTRIGRSNNEL